LKIERRCKINMAMYNQLEYGPVAKIGESISVITAQGTEKFYEVVFLEPLPKSIDLIEDFGSLASGASDNANKVDILAVEGSAKTETDLSEVFQLWAEVMDDITISVKEPAAQARFKTRNDSIRIDYNSGPVELYVFEDDVIYCDVTNTTQYTLNQTRIAFFGWRIVGRQLSKAPEKYTRLVATGFSR